MTAQNKTNSAKPVVERGAFVLVDLPVNGRAFQVGRRVSIDDASPTGRMEYDAIARFLQDAGNDDTDDAGLNEFGLAWVARRAMIEVRAAPTAREFVELTTWCSGTGRRWAERSTQIRGDGGGHVDASVVWIHIDPTTGRPSSWGESFADNYLLATQGRRVDAKLRHSTEIPDAASRQPWRFRATDMDAFGHVNNAAYLALAEELWGSTVLSAPARVEIEWRKPSTSTEDLEIAFHDGQLWLLEPTSGELRLTVTCEVLELN